MQQAKPGRAIPIALNPRPEIEIEAAPVAAALGLDVETFLTLLAQRKIDQLCERGTGDDAGLYRASYYYRHVRARVVVDQQGRMQGEVERRGR
ncbi:MAG: hypothetical protein KGL91_07365 [Xanthomonadaceae bacterium]|nr:hypothetical protein [Xanthomonadaceae bacterium]